STPVLSATPTATSTGGGQTNGPTPTVTATVQPGGEICDNCIDDDGDGLIDRDDVVHCDQPLDGAAAGIGDPVAGKRLVKCAQTIEKAGAKLASSRFKRLHKCLDAAFACTELKSGDAKCVTKATATCNKTFLAFPADATKLTATITKACGPDKVATA